MSMSRKDFRVVAEALRRVRPNESTDPGAYAQWRLDRNFMEVDLTVHYRNFRQDKFRDWTES